MNEFAQVLISPREPYSKKDTLWICTGKKGIIEFKIFDKGWQTILSTEDLGLSEKSKQQVQDLVNKFENSFNFKYDKVQGKYKNTFLTLMNKNRQLEQKINELESKIDKLTKRFGTLLLK